MITPFDNDVANAPKKFRAEWLTTTDTVRLRTVYWEQTDRSKGTIFVLEGATENIEKKGPLIDELFKNGFSVSALDWRGHGLSDRLTDDRLKSHVVEFADFQLDLDALLLHANKNNFPKPWFVVAHSLGACIALRSIYNGAQFAACSFTAPMWALNIPKPKQIVALPLAYLSKSIGKGDAYVPGASGDSYVLSNPFEGNRLTRDPAMFEFYRHVSRSLPDQVLGGVTMSWLLGALREMKSLSKLSPPKIPSAVFCGSADPVVDTATSEARMAAWEEGSFELFKDAKHDISCEIPEVREKFVSDTCALFSKFK